MIVSYGMVTKPKRPQSKAQRQANARFSAGMSTPKGPGSSKSMAETLHRITGMRCGR